MGSGSLVKASEIKVGDKILAVSGHETVTKVYTSGKFVHITTTSGKKTHVRTDLIAKIDD